MHFSEVIERKRDGHVTRPDELKAMIDGLLDDSIPQYQISAWLMAVVFRGMEFAETAQLTRLMMESGEVLDFSDLGSPMVDKHSTGGVGDKITIPLAPLVAAAGVKIPMISGRGLGHTGGTLDKLESIPGLRTDLSAAEFRGTLERIGFSIIAAGAALAPADGRLYALRDVSGTVPSVPLITASILSKKYAAGVDGLVLDVKCGSGAFMQTPEEAGNLARVLVAVSTEMGKSARALVTSMDEPIGATVGNALEVRESIEVLRGDGPDDVRELVLALGAEMLVLAGITSGSAAARVLLHDRIASGAALELFGRWIEAQGGDPRVLEDAGTLPSAPVVRMVESQSEGWLAAMKTREIGFAANELGAGRTQVGDSVDPAVGFVFQVRLGTHISVGQPIVEIHAQNEAAAERAEKRLLDCLLVADEKPMERLTILETVDSSNGS